MNSPTALLICIGNELLSGKTINTNLAFIGESLDSCGIPLTTSVVIPDQAEIIDRTIKEALVNYELIITTGGLGPTSDDITKKCIADAMGKRLIFSEEIWSSIENRFSRRGIKTPEINRSQAEVPEDFLVMKNSLGTAPGLLYDYSGKVVIMLPGVPQEMKKLVRDEVIPFLKAKYQLASLFTKTIHTIEIPESTLAELIEDVSYPDGISVAFLPQFGRVSLRLTGRDSLLVEETTLLIQPLISEMIWGYDNDSLPELILFLLRQLNLTLAVAESCTGGLIQEKLTSIPGASECFEGGIVSYSNRIKEEVLGVKSETLERFGAVSEETAREMSEGVVKLFKVDVGLSVTGIAGPAGGTADKPVGSVCFGITIKQKDDLITETFRRQLSGTREVIRENSANIMLNFLRKRFISCFR